MSDQHSSLIKTPKQLLIVVVLAFAVPITLIGLVSQLVSMSTATGNTESESAVLSRIKPVGEIVMTGAQGAGAGTLATAAAPSALLVPNSSSPTVAMASNAAGAKPDGKKTYDTVCMACHAAGVAGAPKFGDKAAWAPRLQTGINSLYNSAIHGKGAMPPRAGTQLADADIKAAVDYMTAAAK
jgi:cytochrome c5